MFLEIFRPQDPQKLVIFSGPDPVRFAGEQSLPLEGQMILRCVPSQHDKKVRSTSPYWSPASGRVKYITKKQRRLFIYTLCV